MLKVIVGVTLTAFLTALLGGVLAPVVKQQIDRRRERLDASVELIDVLANGLWAYWKMALRVAYYGRQDKRGRNDYHRALESWDGDDAWNIGCDIQNQVSRSKRLLPPESQRSLDQAQRNIVDYLDTAIDRLRQSGTPADWQQLYNALVGEKRRKIDEILTGVTADLRLGGVQGQTRTARLKRLLRGG